MWLNLLIYSEIYDKELSHNKKQLHGVFKSQYRETVFNIRTLINLKVLNLLSEVI
jgi:hypothetical protein